MANSWSNTFQSSLTLPTGATTGARIVLDGTNDEILVYNSAGQLVDTIGGPDGAITVGIAGQPQVVISTNSLFASVEFPTGDSSEVQPAQINSNVVGSGSTRFGALNVFSPDFKEISTSSITLNSSSVDGTVNPSITFICDDGNIQQFPLFLTPFTVEVDAIFTATSRAFGSVSITPSAANTPTSFVINGVGLSGTSFSGQATAETSVPGTQVTGVGVNNLSSNGMTVWLTRTNTTTTIVFWTMESQ